MSSRMKVTFRDSNGQTGVISEALEVDYAGEWIGEVEDCIDRVVEDLGGDDGESPADELDHLIVDLPEAAPIVEVQRTDDTGRYVGSG